MAIYHNSTKIISRGKGRSAISSASYRSAECIKSEYDNNTYDFTRKTGVVYSEIMLPQQAKAEFKNRATLWNEVEKIESSKNSQLAREVEVSLPKELNRAEQIKLVKEYVKDNFVSKGMCADINIHDKSNGNPHCHIMLTMRPIKENGEWGAKAKKEYILDKNGQKIKLKSGQYKSKKIDTTNWNTKEFLQSYRKNWADKINEKLQEKGINERVDHRSFAEQGIEKIATIHEGYVAREMERRGGKSERMEINREIEKQNKKINDIQEDIKKLEELKIQLKELRHEEKNNKSIEELKNERKTLTNEYQEINKKYDMCNEYREKSDLLEKYEKKIESENKYKDSLGFFKSSEKKNINDRVSKLKSAVNNVKDNIAFIKNQLFGGGSVPMTKTEILEQVQKIEMERINIENQLKQNEMELREEQEKAVREQLENERIQKELSDQENKNKIITERPVESGETPKKDIKLSAEDIKMLEQAKTMYQQFKIEMIKHPNDEKIKESAEKLKKILDKYKKPMQEIQREKADNKSRGWER